MEEIIIINKRINQRVGVIFFNTVTELKFFMNLFHENQDYSFYPLKKYQKLKKIRPMYVSEMQKK